MKRGNLLIILSIVILLVIPFISANIFSNWWGKITGKATSDTTALNITVGNSAPTIPFVQAISAQDPNIGTTKSITFNFTATDTDGAANINTGSGAAYFQRAGESTRSNTSCISYAPVGSSINFSCTINLWYFDGNGAWTINATISDINGANGENSSTTFTYNLLTAINMTPTSLGWPPIGVTSTDTGSDTDPITMNNTGNDVDLSVEVTALDLQGETTDTEYIYANNFTISDTTEGCSGTAMVNASATNVTSAILQRGNNTKDFNNATSGQEQIFFCLKGVLPTISAQSYSSAGLGAWTVEVI